MSRWRRRLANAIALVLLGYGLLRLGVGSVLLAQVLGAVDVPGLGAAVEEIAGFLERAGPTSWIATSVAGYVSYIAAMGIVLATGAVGALNDRRFGLPMIGAFLLMYALLFVNFQTINPKVIHLLVCAALFLALVWLRRGMRDVGTAIA
jgi:hypothetical protein